MNPFQHSTVIHRLTLTVFFQVGHDETAARILGIYMHIDTRQGEPAAELQRQIAPLLQFEFTGWISRRLAGRWCGLHFWCR